VESVRPLGSALLSTSGLPLDLKRWMLLPQSDVPLLRLALCRLLRSHSYRVLALAEDQDARPGQLERMIAEMKRIRQLLAIFDESIQCENGTVA
jgi:hypothetical protein